MSQAEVGIVAILQTTPEKADRLKEVLAQAAKWIHEHEPESLAFAFYEERNGDGVRISIYERYASQAAVDKHESSDNYKKVFQTMGDEELLAGAPTILKAPFAGGFLR
ncbi:hypothetical protein BDY17DRAFT_320518 [Neohortaea acidophila]|uniref:ABM domain-containing protein n=1 Tax=Neohortaea acidophila TaxID=245834 RepID=A0A6A6Q6J7_9PEZI|nr:uncharacterized protein BDY17DRAFT_320518 [Neohortaea acidophila]KAF2488010.1 hypothetical protein BDY17DRAFT_320518 [Neohortaea acidophila]